MPPNPLAPTVMRAIDPIAYGRAAARAAAAAATVYQCGPEDMTLVGRDDPFPGPAPGQVACDCLASDLVNHPVVVYLDQHTGFGSESDPPIRWACGRCPRCRRVYFAVEPVYVEMTFPNRV